MTWHRAYMLGLLSLLAAIPVLSAYAGARRFGGTVSFVFGSCLAFAVMIVGVFIGWPAPVFAFAVAYLFAFAEYTARCRKGLRPFGRYDADLDDERMTSPAAGAELEVEYWIEHSADNSDEDWEDRQRWIADLDRGDIEPAGRWARFEYVDRDGVITNREIATWEKRGAYVVGFDRERRGERTFRQDRISAWTSG